MDGHLDSDLLRTFVAIADAGSFTRAAERVHRTQSAISMQIKKLEELTGEPLFIRQARGVVPTPVGETLLTKARQIVRLLDQASQDMRADPLAGALAIGIPEEYGATVLPGVLAGFAERHPNVEVTVRCGSSLVLEETLDRGELDLAVLVIASSSTEGEILFYDPTVWVTSARHLVHEQDPLPIAMFEQGCWWRDWALKILDDRARGYRVAYTSASVSGLQAAVSSGLAVAVLGRSTMPPGARVLGAKEGFSDLPGSSVVLRQAPRRGSEAVATMATVLRSAFGVASA